MEARFPTKGETMSRRALRIAASVLVALSLVSGAAGCGMGLTAVELTAGIKPAEAASLEVGEGSRAYGFALDLLRQSVDGDNVLVSPLSALSALAMAENGASGETLAQMEQVAGMDADELTNLLQAYGTLGDDPPLSLANSIWLRDSDGLVVEDAFLEACGGHLGSQVFSAPFDGSTVDDVNAWVSEETHEMIPQMLDEIPDGAQILLVNALAFEGDWEEPFEEAMVAPDTFTCEDGARRDVTMMRSIEGDYLESELATGFIKPYAGYDYAFVGLLPAEGVSVSELLEELDGSALRSLLTPVEGIVAEIGLPQFTTSYEAELSDALQALGITNAFDPELADFSRMGRGEEGPLFISDVLQKTFIDVNEEGTRAAAATVITTGDGAAAPEEPHAIREVILDRPFVYLIVDLCADMPIFIGVVVDIE